MYNSIKERLKDKVLQNFSQYAIIYGINIAAPLLSVSYIVRVSGIEEFGKYTSALATIVLLYTIGDLGFNYIGPIEISKREGNARVLKYVEIRNTKFTISAIMSIMIFTFSIAWKSDISLAAACTLVYLSYSLSPNWYFEGIQTVTRVTVSTAISKLVYCIAVFTMLNEASTYVELLILLGTSQMGLVLFLNWHTPRVGYKIRSPIQFMKEALKQRHLIAYNTSLYVQSSGPIWILSVFTSPAIVGSYGVIEKVSKFPWTLTAILDKALVPHMSARLKYGTELFIKESKRYITPIQIGIIAIIIGLVIGANRILLLVIGSEVDTSLNHNLMILLAGVVFVVLNLNHSIMLICSSQYDKLQYSITSGTITLVSVGLVLVPLAGLYGMTIAFVMSTVVMYFCLRYYALRTTLQVENVVCVDRDKNEVSRHRTEAMPGG